jgi:hypothetical protein
LSLLVAHKASSFFSSLDGAAPHHPHKHRGHIPNGARVLSLKSESTHRPSPNIEILRPQATFAPDAEAPCHAALRVTSSDELAALIIDTVSDFPGMRRHPSAA